MYFLNTVLAEQMKKADVLVFDMNGLIIDDEPIQLEASNASFKACGYDVKISQADWISSCVGHKPAAWVPSFLSSSCCDAEEVMRIVKKKDALYADLIGTSAKNIVRDGFFDLIEFAQKNNKPCAVASSTTKAGVEIILGPSNLAILFLKMPRLALPRRPKQAWPASPFPMHLREIKIFPRQQP